MKNINRSDESKKLRLARTQDRVGNRLYLFLEKWMKHFSVTTLVGITFLYGHQIYAYADILGSYKVYQYILSQSWLTHEGVGMAFMTLSIVKLIGVLGNIKFLKRVGLTSITFLWTVYAVAFLFSPPPNTVWLNAITMVLISWKTAYDEQ